MGVQGRGRGTRDGLLALAAATLVVAGCTAATPATAPPPAGALSQQVTGAATGEAAIPHLAALERIADDNGGNRAAGTPGYDATVDYVAGVLRDAGFDVTTPTYDAGDGRELRNVVARTRGGDPGRVVLAGAHLDSVPDGPGINDDGSGIAGLLAVATALGPQPGVGATVSFGFWGSEEDDLQGSTGYVSSLSEEQRDQHLLYLNADMLGSPNGGYFVQGGRGEDEEERGPSGSGVVASVLAEELAAAGAPQPETIGLYGDDDAPFAEVGIPVAGAVTGDEDTKSREQARLWGGEAGRAYDECYHSACDRTGNVDTVTLDRYTRAIAATLARFADATQRPSG
ncbi:M28 family peptidase [Pseudonocardia sp. ICBG1293]|uniref:M28 family peptidase n=1 Tax=Pseudonocardia sp. ICBG1293 TaxID=2844382 RepID=UPI001CCCC7F9|nr:M28 family peptidase [Pseudonocardia sp. ICBG1293]